MGQAKDVLAQHTLHTQVVGFWAMNVWNRWIAAELLEEALASSKDHMICHGVNWQKVYAPLRQ